MESSSKIFGDNGAEECQSSESGWTMYLGSSIDDEEDNGGGQVHDDDDDGHGMRKNVYVDDGSDDSMASDASSGPSHLHQQQQQQQPWEGEDEGGRGHGHGHGHDHSMVHKYHKEDKGKKQVKKKNKKNNKSGFEARNEQKEEGLVDEKRSIVTVQSGNKARYIWQRK